MIVTIDGPAASGKSTVAKLIAREIGGYHLNSGLLFRALAYLLVTYEQYVPTAVPVVSQEHVDRYTDEYRLQYDFYQGQARVRFDGADITPLLKNKVIDTIASIISSQPLVRERFRHIQQEIARKYTIVVDGRDCGSAVFPDAQVKFYLTADDTERARRWQHDQRERGNDVSLADALATIKERDQRDMQRTVAPLIIPLGAYVVDTTDLNSEQTLAMMMKIIRSVT